MPQASRGHVSPTWTSGRRDNVKVSQDYVERRFHIWTYFEINLMNA